MENNELLQAIGLMIDERDRRLAEQMSKLMDAKLEPIERRLDKQDEFARGTRVLIESDINKNIQLLFEAQQETLAKFRKLDRIEMTLDSVKSDTEVLKSVITEHSHRLKAIK